MSQQISARPMGSHEYSVDVTEGTTSTTHRVTVPEDLPLDLGLAGVDEKRLVEESFAFLLEKEPVTSIYDEFPLDVLLTNFPDYADEMRTRFG